MILLYSQVKVCTDYCRLEKACSFICFILYSGAQLIFNII